LIFIFPKKHYILPR